MIIHDGFNSLFKSVKNLALKVKGELLILFYIFQNMSPVSPVKASLAKGAGLKVQIQELTDRTVLKLAHFSKQEILHLLQNEPSRVVIYRNIIQ